jgi:GR25 family glycosyltransferase involved in LPS biosynthesis
MCDDILKKYIKKMYVINLDKRTDRYEEFKKRIENICSNDLIARISAVDGTNIVKPPKCSLVKGEIGCIKSHEKIWKEIIENDELLDEDIILTFEDDVFFSDNFNSSIEDALEKFNTIDEKNKLLFIGGRFTPNFSIKQRTTYIWKKIFEDKTFYKRKHKDSILSYDLDRTTHVLIFTKSCIKILYELLKNENEYLKNPIDHFLISVEKKYPELLNYYEYSPHLCYSPLNYKSDIRK